MLFSSGKCAAMAQVCLIDAMRVLVRIMMMPVAKVVDDFFVAQQAEETVGGSRLLTILGHGFGWHFDEKTFAEFEEALEVLGAYTWVNNEMRAYDLS